MEKTRQPIPEGLAEMPPGPGLAAALAAIDLTRLGGLDCVEVLRAQHRQTSHEQARLMAAMVEVGRCGLGCTPSGRTSPGWPGTNMPITSQ